MPISSVPLSDIDWKKIKELRPKLPDEARKQLQDWIMYYAQLQLQTSSLEKDARGKKKSTGAKIEGLHRPASQLCGAMARMDLDTMMAIVGAGSFRPDTLALLYDLQKQIPALVKLLRVATKNTRRRKPGPDGETFEWLVEQWDSILQHYDAGRISRPNYADVALIAKAAAKAAGEKIEAGKLDRAVSRVITARNKREARARGGAAHQLQEMHKRLNKAVNRLQAHILAAQVPDAARRRRADIMAGKTEFLE